MACPVFPTDPLDAQEEESKDDKTRGSDAIGMMTASQRSHYDENASEKDEIELEGSPDGKLNQDVVVSSPT